MDKLLELEQTYQFAEFRHETGLKLIEEMVAYIIQNHLKSIGVRVWYRDRLAAQYLMDGKNEDMWLRKKERSVLDSGHSTLYLFHHPEEYKDWVDDGIHVFGGGGFPIRENGELVGCISVSGLTHEEDHQLIIDTLDTLQKKGEITCA